MNISLQHCKFLFVAAYVSLNGMAYYGSVTTGVLSGDFAGYRAPTVAAGLALLLADTLSYGLVLFPLFNAFGHVGRFKRVSRVAADQPFKIHMLVTALLLFQMLFAVSTGVATAGTFAKPDNPLRFIIYIIPIDLVALIYFAAADNKKAYKINLFIYLLSSLTRGWSFGIALLLAIAAIRLNGVRVTLTRLLILLMFFAAVAPIVLLLRLLVRESEISEVLYYTELALDGENIYVYILGFIADRLQHFTSVAYIFENREAIAASIAAGDIRLFFLDGDFFRPLATLFGQSLPLELNSWMTADYRSLDFDAVASNTHLGIIGWPIAAPSLLPVYLCFVGGIGLCSVQLSRAIGSKFVIELTWLMWLLLLMNGWFGAFISYLVALAFFRFSQLVTSPKISATVARQPLATPHAQATN